VDRVQATVVLSQLVSLVQARLAGHAHEVKPWRVAELTRLAVRHWPAVSLDLAAAAGGRKHRAVGDAMRILQAQIREDWEGDHGTGVLWRAVLGDVSRLVGAVIADLWWSDERWRDALRDLHDHGRIG